MENLKITNIETLQLKEGQTVTINGAVIGLKIVKLLFELQSRENEGIREYKSSYDNLTLFLASEAEYISDKENLAYRLSGIHTMRNEWNDFKIPGTKV